MRGGLTAKQEAFVREYRIDRNATQAAARAGFDLEPCTPVDGHYVYALIDPRDDRIFYIGKGTGRRYTAHAAEQRCGRVMNAAKFEAIASIVAAGLEPRSAFLERNLSEDAALKTERAFIRGVGLRHLTNVARGQNTEMEKAQVWARDRLAKLISWESTPVATRTMYRYRVYCGIKATLEALADGRWPSEDVFAEISAS